MNIIVESNIPYIKGLLEPWASVSYVPASEITHAVVRDAQALLVRTRTVCDRVLLEGSDVRFVGTATIGTDHIDLDYCRRRGIAVHNAPGCNAPAVAQWVHSTIAQWMHMRGITSAQGLKLGVVGVGHVGSIVARWGSMLGFDVVLNDPPLGLNHAVDDCDIITFHTPLTRDTQWPTWHLCDEPMLQRATRCRLIINASRGGVCDDAALAQWHGDVAIDCWEGEPHISHRLLNKAFVATPHIAGYSMQGKQRGTAMVIDALNRHFGFDAAVNMPQEPLLGAEQVSFQSITASYTPVTDTTALKQDPDSFEALRNNYHLRNEVI
ncbi:4-phosphoerythronate dehydrogenase [Sodaliphilus sp.]|uniref:4-phosphoerythronate dehydrogenase n=1 Tax=Sodaliphilus sp. TaxID=2815818 RepID=UPI00388F16E3